MTTPDSAASMDPSGGPSRLAADIVETLRRRGLTIAAAESVTGGLVTAALTDVPGSSAVVRAGVVAYATDIKHGVLGVDADLLERDGAVHPGVAEQMAVGVRNLTGADLGVSTTGVAGPDPQDGHDVGTVWIAVAGPGERVTVVDARAAGDRWAIRRATVRAALVAVGRAAGQCAAEEHPPDHPT
ncbi:MAG: CinA family protein [Angustibacter sp.]